MLDIHAEVDEVCNPPCENGICAANNTCNCFAGYQGERCTEEGRFCNLIISTSSFKHQDAYNPIVAFHRLHCRRRKAGRCLGTRLDIILVAYAAALLCVSYLGGMGARQITRYESIMSDFNYMLLLCMSSYWNIVKFFRLKMNTKSYSTCDGC